MSDRFDRPGFLTRLMGDEDLARELLAEFQQDCQAQLAALGDALARGDTELVRRQAHSIKGAAANTGALRVTEVAFLIEQAAKAADLPRCASLQPELETELTLLAEAVRDAGLGPPA